MGLYNFRPRFVPYVLDGTKTHTIRAERKVEDEPGSTMHLFTGLRTKKARLLLRAPMVKWEPIVIDPAKRLIALSETQLREDEMNALAWRDGFRPEWLGLKVSPFDLMLEFWRDAHPHVARFAGRLKHWDFEARQVA